TAATRLLRARNVSKSFPGQPGLSNVDLYVSEGAIGRLVGQNGSGKSTLAKILTGVYAADPGAEITVRGRDGTELHGSAAAGEVHVIHQDLGLIPMLSTVENLTLARAGSRTDLLPAKGKAERQAARQMIPRVRAPFQLTPPGC